MVSAILELPQKVRESKENLIIHSIIVGNSINFNVWFNKCNRSFDNSIGQHLLHGYRTRLFCGVFDLPARAKALNMLNHAGYNSCINCTINGEYDKEYKKVVFPFADKLTLRTKSEYNQILKSASSNKTVQGK